jgi:hypothetical protein
MASLFIIGVIGCDRLLSYNVVGIASVLAGCQSLEAKQIRPMPRQVSNLTTGMGRVSEKQ